MQRISLAALSAAVVLAAGAAQAQTVITRPVQTETVVTTPGPLVLTPAQRQVIYRNVVRERAVAPAATVGAAPVVQYEIGARVPTGVTLYDVPQTVVTEVPAVSRYRYMVVNNRAWLVDPITSEIVAEVAE